MQSKEKDVKRKKAQNFLDFYFDNKINPKLLARNSKLRMLIQQNLVFFSIQWFL